MQTLLSAMLAILLPAAAQACGAGTRCGQQVTLPPFLTLPAGTPEYAGTKGEDRVEKDLLQACSCPAMSANGKFYCQRFAGTVNYEAGWMLRGAYYVRVWGGAVQQASAKAINQTTEGQDVAQLTKNLSDAGNDLSRQWQGVTEMLKNRSASDAKVLAAIRSDYDKAQSAADKQKFQSEAACFTSLDRVIQTYAKNLGKLCGVGACVANTN